MAQRDSVMARNISVLAGDQQRVAGEATMSLRGAPSPRGDRVYVGDCQEITVSFGTGEADIPKAFAVALAHVPTKVQPRSGIKISSGTSLLAVINEWHGTPWTQTQIWLMASQDNISCDLLVI